MKIKVLFTEEKTGMQVIERRYTRPTGYHDQEGEWNYTGREPVHLIEVVTKSGEKLHALTVLSHSKLSKVRDVLFYKAKEFLYCYSRLAYSTDFKPSCNRISGDYSFPRTPCPLIAIHQDKVLCQVHPFPWGYASSSDGSRPLPQDMKCDLRGDSVPNIEAFKGLSLRDLLDCASGKAKEKIERQPVDLDAAISLGWEGIK